ncbi:MAG: helix-turn-helix domain-containing protein [bacterium]|nr:helix-turn-helix domain-containing protein [bacterium]
MPEEKKERDNNTAGNGDTKESMGQRFRQFRETLDMTRTELAGRLGVTTASVINIETGKAVPPSGILIRLHGDFRLNLNWMLTGTESMRTIAMDIDGKRRELLELMQVPEVEQFIFSQLEQLKPRAGVPDL